MEDTAATIWVKIGGSSANNSLRVGGIYRQHHLLGQEEMVLTNQELIREQEHRWTRIVDNWKAAGRRHTTLVIGDMNLDQARWASPEANHINMIEKVQNDRRI